MPTFSRSLEQALHRALSVANDRGHEYATLEHLLLALIDDTDAAAVMRACNVDLDVLQRNLEAYINDELASLVLDDGEDSKPTAGFQRVIQRAVIHVQSSGREEVTGANVLVAIFAERESHAAYFLQEQDMTRYDAVNYLSQEYLAQEKAERPGRGTGNPLTAMEASNPLTAMEEQIIRMRFGIPPLSAPQSYAEVAARYSTTPDEIRAIERQAIVKLLNAVN